MKALALLGMILFGAAVGCGGGSGVSLEQLPAAYAQTLCDQNFKCASAADIMARTKQDCLDDNQAVFLLISGSIRDGQAKGRLAYDATKMGECLSAMGKLSCAEWVTGLAEPAGCKEAFTAKVNVGNACQNDAECIMGACDGADSSTTPPTDGLCKATIAHGAACTFADTCIDGDYCNETTSTCAAKKAGGEACTANSDECGNSCNPDTSKCSGYAGCAVAPISGNSTLLSVLGLGLVLVAARRRQGRA